MKTETEKLLSSDPNDWPLSLDALIAAPEHHTLIFENENVRVLRTLIPPGETTGMHTHRWPSVIHALSRSHYLRRNGAGTIIQDTRTQEKPGSEFHWSAPLPPHSIENVGDRPIHLILVELKKTTP